MTKPCILAVDAGGTSLKAMLAYPNGTPVPDSFLQVPVDSQGSAEEVARSYQALSQAALELSGKTGFTGTAGYCYVGALTRDERTYIVALLACGWPNNKSYKWSDTKRLMEYGIAGFPVYGYTYNDFLNHVPFSVQKDIWLVFIGRYDLLKEQFAPQFDHWPDVIFMVDCKTDCAALEDSQECYINMESDRITVWNV